MAKKKLTPEEEEIRKKTLEEINNKLEDINCMFKLMASCYTQRMYEFDDCTNKGLEIFLKKLCRIDAKLERFRERNIPDICWEFAEIDD